jgi:chromosome partitioning protein
MQAYLVANPKGGSGKTTLATNLAGYLARSGRRVMLGDIDRIQSARQWLQLRPAAAPKIRNWDIDPGAPDRPARPPRDTTHAVLDSPAGLHGKKLAQVLRQVDQVLVPLAPSIFDIMATRDFLDALLEEKAVRRERLSVAIVGMRVDLRTRAAGELERFLDSYRLPVLAYLRDTQLYVQAAAHGLTLWDLPLSRVERDLEQWRPIVDWVESAA